MSLDSDLSRSIGDAQSASSYVNAFRGDVAALTQALTQYRSGSLSSAEQQVYGRVQSDVSLYQQTGTTVLRLMQASDLQSKAAARKLYFSQAVAINDRLGRALSQLVQINDGQAAADSHSIRSNRSTSTTVTIVFLALAVLAGGGIAFVVSRAIKRSAVTIMERLDVLKTKGAERLTAGLRAFAEGDLTQQFEITTSEITDFPGDELGGIQRTVEELRSAVVVGLESYNTTAGKLNAVLAEVSGSAGQVSAASIAQGAGWDQTHRGRRRGRRTDPRSIPENRILGRGHHRAHRTDRRGLATDRCQRPEHAAQRQRGRRGCRLVAQFKLAH